MQSYLSPQLQPPGTNVDPELFELVEIMQLCVWAKDRNSKRLPFHCCATLASTKERSHHKFLVSRREVEDVLLRQELLSIPCLLDSVLYSKAVQIFLLSHFVYFVSTRCIHFTELRTYYTYQNI